MRTKRQVKRLKHEIRAARRVAKVAPFIVKARRNCGCCEETLRFTDKQSAVAAFRTAGLDSSATIVDDAGDVHQGVDTFYGFNPDKDGMRRLVDYLIESNKAWPDMPRKTRKPFK